MIYIFLKTTEQGIWTPTDWKWTLYNNNKHVPDSIKFQNIKEFQTLRNKISDNMDEKWAKTSTEIKK